MIILSRPYVSQMLESFIIDNAIPVFKFDDVSLVRQDKMKLLGREEFFARAAGLAGSAFVYTNAENSLSLLRDYLPQMDLLTSCLKDKYRFRKATERFYPDLRFKKLDRAGLSVITEQELDFPLVLKPIRGFFSMGVYKIDNFGEWKKAIHDLELELARIKGIYPGYVLDTEVFLIEDCIEGEEYAVDAYFNSEGKAVIINILKHPHNGSKDTSHRIYYTSKEIMENMYSRVLKALADFSVFNLKNYAGHIEFRLGKNKKLIPVEFNPLRFAGWCTTDLAYYAYGINPYEHLFFQKEPDWEKIINSTGNKNYCINVADIPAGIDRSKIKGINYGEFLKIFSEIFELRKINYREYPVFSMLLTAGDNSEIHRMQSEDLTKYLTF
jgi:hypothetical protein